MITALVLATLSSTACQEKLEMFVPGARRQFIPSLTKDKETYKVTLHQYNIRWQEGYAVEILIPETIEFDYVPMLEAIVNENRPLVLSFTPVRRPSQIIVRLLHKGRIELESRFCRGQSY